MKKKILIIVMLFCLILLSSCETKTEDETPDANKESYELAQKAGYTDSYTKWCELISGVEASQIKEVNLYENGELTVTLDNDKIIKLISIAADIIPSYQGMSAEKIETKRNARRNANNFKSSVDDFLEIETSNKIEFYTSKNETFNIIVHLYNPKSYEILSFTLNGIKYQSYEFQEGSNSSKLIINVTSPNNPGLCEYTIDAIKYIDGSTIKDVSMDGEKTIKVGVKYDNLPSCKLLNESITIDTINLSVDIKDDNNLINTKNGLYFFLFDGTRIIESQKLSIGVNNIKYNLLQMSTNYEYMIVSVYDDYSGNGLRSVSLYEGSFKSMDGVTINPSLITDNTITVETTKYNNSIKIKEINLYNGDELINTSNLDTTLFTSLLSNHEYLIEVVYTYLLNNNVITSKVTKEVSTLPKTKPSVELSSLDVSKNSINYQLKINDPNNTIVTKEIKLFKNDQVYQTKTQDKDTFTSLLSDNDYIVKIIYTYDLNDGGNIKEESLETKVHTQKNIVPTIVIKNVNTTSSNVTFKYEVLSDVTTNISSIELRKMMLLLRH